MGFKVGSIPHRVLRLVRESDFLEIFLSDQLAVMQLLQIWHKEGPKGLLVLTNDHDLFYEVRCQDGVLCARTKGGSWWTSRGESERGPQKGPIFFHIFPGA